MITFCKGFSLGVPKDKRFIRHSYTPLLARALLSVWDPCPMAKLEPVVYPTGN